MAKELLPLLLLIAVSVRGANILGLFTSQSPSHLIVHMSLVELLAEQGHNVTVVAMTAPKVKHANIHTIIIPATPERQRQFEAMLAGMAAKEGGGGRLAKIKGILNGLNTAVEAQFELAMDPRFAAIYGGHYDLLILGYAINDFLLGVAAQFKCPIIVNWMQAPNGLTDAYVANPTEPAYVPHLAVSMERGELMDFGTRLNNYLLHGFMQFLNIVFDYRCEQKYNALFAQEPNFPSYQEMKRNVSLVFTNSHSLSEGPIRPLVPGYIEIGGIQVKDKPSPLPAQLAEYLDTASEGVILLSLGTNMKGSHIKPNVAKDMFSVLASLKQRVIWKWDDLANTPGNATNILYSKWLPQDDILAHPNTKLFITHAGKGSVVESTYHGVPMVALPIFGDQPMNAARMLSAGYGLTLELRELEAAEFEQAIDQVLQNPVYRQNVQQFSQLYRDRPLSAKKSVYYWTEYVLRHKGARHLQSPSLHMGFIARNNIDVYALLGLILYIIGWLIKRLVIYLYAKCKRSEIKLKQN